MAIINGCGHGHSSMISVLAGIYANKYCSTHAAFYTKYNICRKHKVMAIYHSNRQFLLHLCEPIWHAQSVYHHSALCERFCLVTLRQLTQMCC